MKSDKEWPKLVPDEKEIKRLRSLPLGKIPTSLYCCYFCGSRNLVSVVDGDVNLVGCLDCGRSCS